MLHIGGFRTALYAWLLARHHGGKFILRVEDTDQERKVDGAIRYILEGFDWFGIEIDEGPTAEELSQVEDNVGGLPTPGGSYGPYIQSLRKERYQEIADLLVEKGVAFRCDCTKEQLDKEREEQRESGETPGYSGRCRDRSVSKDAPHVVRFQMPEKPDVTMVDGVRGEITWESIPLRDPVLMKTDGLPTYHLAVVVDDHDMKISHVLRGEEWIPSAPLHILLYEALGWEKPVFCHLPVVLGSDGKKLSKRHGATSWSSFREDGYLPEAVLNFITLIGWSPGEGEEKEVFEPQELIERFMLDRVNASSAVFDYTKLNWMNGVYMRSLTAERFKAVVQPWLAKEEIEVSESFWSALTPHLQERVKLAPEIVELAKPFVPGPVAHQLDQMINKKLDVATALALLERVSTCLSGVEDWQAPVLEETLKGVMQELELKPGQVFVPVRIAATGSKTPLPLFESLEALGKAEVVARTGAAITALRSR
jgi:glutamyl-tRNA synthetase